MEQRFGESPPLSLGIEEELMLVHAATHAQVPAVRTLLAALEGRSLPGVVKTELFASVVELNTPPSQTVSEAAAKLRELRRGAAAAAAEHGLALVAAGSHPVSRPEEQEIADEERYKEFVAYAGVSARRQGVQGLHVHVGMPDADSCLRVLENVLPWLPIVLAVSTNSPYLAGVETGMASNRAEVLAMLPRAGAPPRFDTFAEWARFVERLTAIGVIKDYTTLWWDIRPHPRYGTLEIRMPDQPTDVERAVAFVDVLRGLCRHALDQDLRPLLPGDRALYQQNRWAAARFGPRATLVHPAGDRMASVDELWAELVELARPAAVLTGGNEGDRQLEMGRRDGLDAVCADLARRSVASP